MQPEDELGIYLAAAMAAARAVAGTRIIRIACDWQDSGELPYRIEVPDEPLPLVGVAYLDQRSDLQTISSPAERDLGEEAR